MRTRITASRGFTIVELLIVSVVNAILAPITIVSYTGIQNRARDTTNKSDAQTLAQIAETVYADKSVYPTGTTDATLTASFNQSDISTIPNNVAVKYLSSAGTNPVNSAAITAADSTPRTYTVKVCNAGLIIFYPNRVSTPGAGTIQTMVVGTTASATSCT
jgi:prepilin-type N-terminal cleavage/methylation domain-containing protein